MSSSNPTNNAPSRTSASTNQTLGSAKETLGNLIGSDDLKRSGAEQNERGKGEEAEAQLSDLGSGIGDRAKGRVGNVVAAVTGDDAKQEEYKRVHDQGKAKERSVEEELKRQS
ncbi:MAG: hypothetical protein M1816_001983 [Peltula sp. TS41687]|nr:MAG: hypothetical protein M1816_001983 [Peltula sp. TS41687]